MAHTVPVKIISGGSTNLLRSHVDSPVRSVSAGATIALLNACLVTGFGQVTLSSLTIDAQGIATATSTAHGYVKTDTVVLIAGADQEAINGEWVITEITDADHLKFDASESGLTNTTITGTTITLKVAPLGWSKPFFDTPNSIAVFQSLDPFSRRAFLRVDDSNNLSWNEPGATFFRGYEFLASSQDQGTYPFPPPSSLTQGIQARKSLYQNAGIYITTNGANLSWTLVGTSKQFYFGYHVVYGNDNRTRNSIFFGDLNSYVPGDVGATGLCGEILQTQLNADTYSFTQLNNYSYSFCPRNSKKGHTTAQQRFKLWSYPTLTNAFTPLCGGNSIVEPDIYHNRMIIYRPFLITDENNSTSIRGEMPGMAVSLSDWSSISVRPEPGSVVTLNGERFVYMPVYNWSSTYGFYLLSLDLDWANPLL